VDEEDHWWSVGWTAAGAACRRGRAMLVIVLATVSAVGVALVSTRAGAPRPEGPRVPEVAVSVIRAGGAEGGGVSVSVATSSGLISSRRSIVRASAKVGNGLCWSPWVGTGR
jgi:hypothetical protein